MCNRLTNQDIIYFSVVTATFGHAASLNWV